MIKGLFVRGDTCDTIFASHVLEHLALYDFRLALSRTLKLLKLGGMFRIIVPDLHAYVEGYLNSSDPMAANDFMKTLS